jgi:iron complex outermembrane receptor protein
MFFICFQAFAQEISGTVMSDGEPIPGVNIINNTDGKGTLTDFDGNFTLEEVSPGDEIEFSYLGFESQKIVFDGQTEINISLKESSEKLEEVIVTGYGSQIAKNLSSAIVRVDGEKVKNTALGSFEQALQGRAAGVQVVTGSGMSGSATKIRIRGANSAIASSEPLYVVDGIIMESGGYMDTDNSVNFMDMDTNLLASINPNDIASMEILKDAAATAIYGARGSNGVILITTKQGQSGETKIEASFDVGLSEGHKKT